MYYRQLRAGVDDTKSKFIDASLLPVSVCLKNPKQDYYLSIYKFTEEQHKTFLEKNSIKGVSDVVTDKLIWDFDNEDPAKSKRDAFFLCVNLIENHSILEENLCISFSGNKGFHVELFLHEDLNKLEFKAIVRQVANGLETFDSKIFDHARPFRLLGSYHLTSGLYKTRITLKQLENNSITEIKEYAKNQDSLKTLIPCDFIHLPESLKLLKEFKKEYKPKIEVIETTDVDWKNKPKNFTNCRWGLYNGNFSTGDRNTAFLCLAATFKNQGDNRDIAYRRLKGVAETQSKLNNCSRYEDEQLYNNIICQVYDDGWKNGQYSCRDKENWLYEYCQSLGKHKCNHKDEDALKPKKLGDIHSTFKNYVVNIEKNTISTGLPSLDAKIFLSTGCNVGIIGAPGSGKTSIALDILNYTSKTGVKSVLASLDMHYNRLFEKVLYRVSKLQRNELYELFKNNQEAELMKQLDEEFGNVNFFHKSCPTVQDIKDYVLACEEESGEKVKLVMLDYFERVTSDIGDDTAASKRVAGELQDLVNDLDICLVTLVQPNKMALGGGPDSPITSYTSIKGSSYVYQAFRIIFSLWRPFYNPTDFSDDKYMQMAILKNDLGELSELTFGWNGHEGRITEIEDHQYQEFKELLMKKAEKKANDNKREW